MARLMFALDKGRGAVGHLELIRPDAGRQKDPYCDFKSKSNVVCPDETSAVSSDSL
jgi:hypothetical protein